MSGSDCRKTFVFSENGVAGAKPPTGSRGGKDTPSFARSKAIRVS